MPKARYLITVRSYYDRNVENDIANKELNSNMLNYSDTNRDQLALAIVAITQGVANPVLGVEKNQ